MQKLTTLKKPSPKEAYSLIKRFREGEDLSQEEKDQLLNYFAPALPKIAKNAFDWVASACGAKSELREFPHVIHVKDGEMTATDAFRIHWAATTLEDGQYDPKTGLMLAKPVKNVPDFNQLKVQVEKGGELILFHQCEILPAAKKASPPSIKINEEISINSAYLLAALNMKEVRGAGNLKEDRVFGVNAFGHYLIMGLKK